MIKFSSFLEAVDNQVFFTFGRMNPPTIGHEKLLDTLAKKAGNYPYRVYLSQSQDAQKNPLSYNDKIKYARKAFPKYARNIIMSTKVKTVFDVMVELYDAGFSKVTMVVGDDRVREFDILLNKYNGEKGRHGLYKFEQIKVVSAGERDPDADGVSGMSASKIRGFAADGDYTSFSQGLPKSLSNTEAKKLYNDIRKAMGLSEETNFTKHVQLDPVSEAREKYVLGALFEKGDTVVIKESDEVGTIQILGTNYVIVEMADKKRMRKWLDDVEKIIVEDKYKDPAVPKAKHLLDPNLSLGHEIHHATSHNIDRDNDGDVDELDKLMPMTPDELADTNKKATLSFIDKYKKEKQHTKKGDAFQ